MKYQPNNDGYSENGTIYLLLINGKETPVTVRETSLNNAISLLIALEHLSLMIVYMSK